MRGALGDALVFDEVLFAISDTHGIEAWDVATGTCIAHAPTLTPVRYHPTARVFLSLLPDGGALLSRVVMASP